MSRNRIEIDLNALPTVADHDDDDLIDRDEQWHEYQRQKTAAEAPAEEIVEAPAPEMAPEPVQAEIETEPEPEVFQPQAEEVELEPEIAISEPPAPEPPPVIQKPVEAEVTRLVVQAPKRPKIPVEAPIEPAPEKEPEAETPEAAEKTPVEVPKPPPEPELTEEEKKQVFWRRWKEKIGANSLAASIIIHLVLLAIAALITVRHVMNKQVDFLPGGSPASQAASEQLEHKVRQKRLKTNKPPKLAVKSITAQVQLPEMEMDALDLSDLTDKMELGKLGGMGGGGMGLGGAGGGFGQGIGRGGAFNFLGQTAFGTRVVYVVDVSGSMEAVGDGGKTRMAVLKRELDKSLSRVPAGSQFQVICFSDFAWAHNVVNPTMGEKFEKARWDITSAEWKKAKIPAFAYLQGNLFNINESRKLVTDMPTNGGTNWGAGLLMALKGNPRPDIIFFMTDGQRVDEQGWIDIITEENHRFGKPAVIHTSVMMETDAAEEMNRLAKSNGGTFTVVLKDGTVMRGDKYFSN